LINIVVDKGKKPFGVESNSAHAHKKSEKSFEAIKQSL